MFELTLNSGDLYPDYEFGGAAYYPARRRVRGREMGQRILVFESDTAFAQEMRSNFERLGATVDLANDGPEGLDLAEAHRPDLILLSIELPGMNGF